MPRLCISDYHKTSNTVVVNHCYAVSISKGIAAGITSVGKLILPDVDMNSVMSMLYFKLEKLLTDEILNENLKKYLKKDELDEWDLLEKGEELVEGMSKAYAAHELSQMELAVKAEPQMTIDDFAEKYSIKKLPGAKLKALPPPAVVKPAPSADDAKSLEVTINVGDVVYPINNFFSVQSVKHKFVGLVCSVNGDRIVICGVYADEQAPLKNVVNFVTVSKYLFRSFNPTEKEYETYMEYVKRVEADPTSGDLYHRVAGMLKEKYNQLTVKETADV